MSTHPVSRIAPLFCEIEAVLREQADHLQQASLSSRDPRYAVRQQVNLCLDTLGSLRVHCGACLGLLMMAEDADVFTAKPKRTLEEEILCVMDDGEEYAIDQIDLSLCSNSISIHRHVLIRTLESMVTGGSLCLCYPKFRDDVFHWRINPKEEAA